MSLAYDIAVKLNNGQEPATNGDGFLTFCPAHNDLAGGKPSLSIVDSDESHGITVKCHVGCDWKDIKDALAERGLVEKYNGSKVSHAKITTSIKDTPPFTSHPRSSSPSKSGSFPWDKAKSDEASISLITKYFAGRKIFFNDKFSRPCCFRWGSYKDKKSGQQVNQIVAAATKPGEEKVIAIQRLFMEVDGDKVVKTGMKMLGECKGRGIWFDRHGSMKDLIVAEGIETTLSCLQATGYNGVAGLSAAGMKAIVLPEGIEHLYVCVDSDPGYAGQLAGIKLAERVERECGSDGSKEAMDVSLVTPCDDCFTDNPTKLDFNDLDVEEIKERFAKSVKREQVEWKAEKKEVEESEGDGDGYYTDKALQGLKKINGSYAVVLVKNELRVIQESFDEVKQQHDIDFLKKTTFQDLFANQKVPIEVKDDLKMKPLGALWWDWPDRRQYKKIVFDPGGRYAGDHFNLFRGFPLKAVKGDWALMLEHIEKIVCAGDHDIFLYVMAWLARAIQDPGGKKPGVALVLVGGKGSGKGVFAYAFGKLFGKAFIPITSDEGFTGRFNMHLAHGLLIFLDEAIWAGSKPSEGRLKALITEPVMHYEAKGVDALSLDNFMNIIIASNEDWVVPASDKERRFCVLKQDESKNQNFDYFDAIDIQMESGGYEAMYYDLLHYDYSGINLRKAPQTEGLASQYRETFNTVQTFWYDVLSRDSLLTGHGSEPVKTTCEQPIPSAGVIPDEEINEYWPEHVWKFEIYHEFTEFCKKDNHKFKRTNEVHFWRQTYKTILGKPGWFFVQNKKGERFVELKKKSVLKKSFTKMNGNVPFDDFKAFNDNF